jgi:hypothetical protein
MKNLTLISFLFLIPLSLIAQKKGKASFKKLIKECKITFSKPDDLKEIKVDFFYKIPHQIAFEDSENKCQVRIFIQPLKKMLKDYNKKPLAEKKKSLDPNQLCKSSMLLAVLNASNNSSRDYQVPKKELTKKVSNADWQAVAMVKVPYKNFQFKYCYIDCHHKDGVGDVYIYYLAEEKEDFINIVGKMAKALKFQ